MRFLSPYIGKSPRLTLLLLRLGLQGVPRALLVLKLALLRGREFQEASDGRASASR